MKKKLKILLETSTNSLKIWQKVIKRYQENKKRRECFWEKYPGIFNDSSENEVEMDIGEGKTRPKKPNLAEIREKFLCKRTTEAFTDYHSVESDPSLTLMEKMI